MAKMMEEVFQQPPRLAGVRKYYTSPGAVAARTLRQLARQWPPTVVLTGMGSSLFAAYPAQAYLSAQGLRAIVWETAELLHHHLKSLGRDTLLVAVSQSGESVEIVRLLERLPRGMGVVAVANHEASTLAKRADLLLPMMAGPQETVSTNTYMCAVAVLMYLAHAITRRPHRTLTETLARAIEAQEQILDQRAAIIPPTVEFFDAPPYVALMSRGADLASAYQGALMFKEVARLGAEPMSAAQFRHGPIEIIHPTHRYVVFARGASPGRERRESPTASYLLRLARDIGGHGGKVLLFSDMPFGDVTGVRLIRVEPLRLGLGTLVDTVYIQLLAHDLALSAGRTPGEFWIAEKVTRVE